MKVIAAVLLAFSALAVSDVNIPACLILFGCMPSIVGFITCPITYARCKDMSDEEFESRVRGSPNDPNTRPHETCGRPSKCFVQSNKMPNEVVSEDVFVRFNSLYNVCQGIGA